MIAINPENTVGEIAAGHPLSVPVFEQLGIDYCCGGQSALRDACRARGLDMADVVLKIHAAGEPADPPADWLLAPLGGMLAKLLVKHPRHADVLRPLADTFHPMKTELEAHLM